jgi:putative transposase
MKKSLETKIVLDVLTMAKWRSKPVSEVIIHSDQGSQFGSDEFNRWCKYNRLSPSMSRRGTYWGNALAGAILDELSPQQVTIRQ